ncbi:MAG: hypothetical protein LBH43_07805 [Treponema sp.]|nr:hypothetical protein [Treponema sp.]
MNCRHYLPGSHSDCAESQAEAPSDRERANFCDWFSLNPKFRETSDGSKAVSAAVSAKAAFDGLFN